MAEFLRPEARAAIWRAREIIAASVILALGLRWGLGSFGLLAWLGWAMVAAALIFGAAAFQRMRFAPGRGGPGVVQIDERRLTYFGPLAGGSVALDDIERIEIDRTGKPAHWRLGVAGGDVLPVPLNAEGAEALFDAFSSLPGMRAGRLVDASRETGTGRLIVWTRPGATPAPSHIAIARRDD